MATLAAMTDRVLGDVDPPVAAAVRRVLEAMATIGYPMAAYSGRRTVAQQQALYARGRSVAGRIVTDLDGVRRKSVHQTGGAVDCAFIGSDGVSLAWEDDLPWEAYGVLGEACGLAWGGRWRRLVDRPHLERRR